MKVRDLIQTLNKLDWDNFRAKELEFAPMWDGHESKDVVRLLSLL